MGGWTAKRGRGFDCGWDVLVGDCCRRTLPGVLCMLCYRYKESFEKYIREQVCVCREEGYRGLWVV